MRRTRAGGVRPVLMLFDLMLPPPPLPRF